MQPSTDHGQALPAGTRLEEFVIERVLGSGGFGITYLASDTALSRRVVIKENLPAQFCFRDTRTLTVTPRQTDGEDFDNFEWSLTNFTREASTLAAVDHPSIVRVLRSFRAGGTAYFVMPFIDGWTLDQEIKWRAEKSKPFHDEELLALLEHVLDALVHLHEQGIFHRDVKPSNILLSRKGIPILIDFGSARQMISERSMTVVESAGYTPFEQLQSRGNVGPWSDLYALGGTLAKTITGEMPPKANDRVFGDPWQPLAKQSKWTQRHCAALLSGIDKAFMQDPVERWQTAEAWLDLVKRTG